MIGSDPGKSEEDNQVPLEAQTTEGRYLDFQMG
jgi:hypothetical protein